MMRKIAEYKVKPDKVGEAEGAIQEFVAAISAEEPDTFYTAYQKDDGVSFIHFMAFRDAEAEKKHQKAPYTSKFVEILYPNCEEQPRFTDLTLVDSVDSDAETA